MKVAIILAIALVVILTVHEADGRRSCIPRCKYICTRRRRCGYYAAIYYCHRCYCKCLSCASEQTIKFHENEESSLSEIFPQMNDNDNTDPFQNIPKGETEHGETGM
ncbi:uncharacterized protein LOC127736489 [Mytilus californianus]|uniref:Mytilin 6 n=1 Tax=Mytilus californianus TaxID=6549 RepID=A0A6B9XKT7_MYTCA|nr:uncharacterized protein LOC127736489 [Mytilus californianus]QHR84800.1 mytilin 6 [Mytilus californianus]